MELRIKIISHRSKYHSLFQQYIPFELVVLALISSIPVPSLAVHDDNVPIKSISWNFNVLFASSNIMQLRIEIVTHNAWIIPGMSPSKVRIILMHKSDPHPRRNNTASGGMNKARIARQISLIRCWNISSCKNTWDRSIRSWDVRSLTMLLLAWWQRQSYLGQGFLKIEATTR